MIFESFLLSPFKILLDPIDEILSNWWEITVRSKQSLVHWPMFEACVAGGSFAIWIMAYRIADRLPCMQQYRFNQDSSHLTTTTNVSQIASDSFDLSSWLPLFVYLFAIYVFHLFVTKKPIIITSPTIVRLFVEVAFGIFVYDFIFFFIHRAMHSSMGIPAISRIFNHQVHHSYVNDTFEGGMIASQVQHHSFVDATLQVATNIFVQNLSLPRYGPKHSLSRIIHNIVITYLLTEIHAGYDGWWCTHNVYPVNLMLCGAKCHEIHHQTGIVHYQQFFTYLDVLFGTV